MRTNPAVEPVPLVLAEARGDCDLWSQVVKRLASRVSAGGRRGKQLGGGETMNDIEGGVMRKQLVRGAAVLLTGSVLLGAGAFSGCRQPRQAPMALRPANAEVMFITRGGLEGYLGATG